MANKNLEVLALEAKLQRARERVECQNPRDARQIVEFAYRCLTETPVAPGQTACQRVTNADARTAVAGVKRWLDGAGSREELEAAAEAVEDTAGEFVAGLTGARAAVWAAVYTVQAAAKAAAVGERAEGLIAVAGQDEDDAEEVAKDALLACHLARQSAVEQGREAVGFQLKLLHEMWPGANGASR
jgi:hypothetical protein